MFTQKTDNPGMFDINLQLFNNTPAGAPAAPAAPAPSGEPAAMPAATPEPASTGDPTTGDPKPASFEELWNKHSAAGVEPNPFEEPTGEPVAQPVQPTGEPEPPAPVTPEWAQNLPDKFKNADGSINYEALATSYVNLEPELTRKSTELAQLKQQLQGQPQQPAQQAPQGQPEYTPEQMTQMGEQILDGLLDPSKTLETLSGIIKMAVNQAQQNIMPKIAPLLEEREHNQYVSEWNQQIQTLAQTNPDIEQLAPVMAEVLDEPIIGQNGQPMTMQGPNGQIIPVTTGDYLAMMPNGVQVAYNLAKSRQAQNLKSPEELLNDNSFWAKAAEHPEIKKMVLTANAKEVYASNQQVPTVIGSSPAGTPPATPPEKPKSAEEAGRKFGDWLRFIRGF